MNYGKLFDSNCCLIIQNNPHSQTVCFVNICDCVLQTSSSNSGIERLLCSFVFTTSCVSEFPSPFFVHFFHLSTPVFTVDSTNLCTYFFSFNFRFPGIGRPWPTFRFMVGVRSGFFVCQGFWRLWPPEIRIPTVFDAHKSVCHIDPK